MELRQLQIFCTAAEMLNFTKAGQHLGYAQSNITGQIRQLESELGVKLFERIGRKVQLTHQGESLLYRSRHILALCAQTKEDFVSADIHGILNIGAAETACVYRLPPIFDKFHKLYPLVELRIQTESCEHFYELLKNNIVDLAFILTDKVRNPEIIAQPLFPEEMSVVVSPAHPLAAKHTITLEDFQNECLIITMPGCGYRPLILSLLEQNHIHPLSFMELSSIAAIKECTHCGLGVAILPRISAVDYIRQGKLLALSLQGARLQISTQMIYHREKWLSPIIKTFLQVCNNCS